MIHPIEESPVVQIKQETSERKFSLNTVLWIVAIVILVGVIATYFVEELPGVEFDFKNISGQVIIVFLGGFSLGELFKRIAINKAHDREEYLKAKKYAEGELAKIDGDKKTGINAYCEEAAHQRYLTVRNAILDKAKITVEDFEKKYATLSKREILKRYPDCGLSKVQFEAIKAANGVKRQVYDPDFLQSVVVEESELVPSKRFNVRQKNVKNTVSSIIGGAFGTLFAVSLASQLIFAFSPAVLLTACIKILSILITIAFKFNFGWNLVMVDEINRLALQAKEAQNYCIWWDSHNEMMRKQPVEGV